MDVSLRTKIAFITGAANGIGRATAIKLYEAGANVILVDIDAKSLQGTVELMPTKTNQKFISIVCDVTSKEQVESAFDQAVEVFGEVNVLVNNAGIMPAAMLMDQTEELWERVLNVNVKSMLLTTQAFSRRIMDKRPKATGPVDGKFASIINMSSLTTIQGGNFGLSSYVRPAIYNIYIYIYIYCQFC